MPANLTLHTNRTLYNKWNTRYEDIKVRIQELRNALKATDSDKRIAAIDEEIQELYIQANLIHQFLADVGLMAYVDKAKQGSGVS